MTKMLGPVMLDLEGTRLTPEERALLALPEVGGVILFARNVESATQVRELCDAIRRIRPGLLLAIDQEGGRVQRLRSGVTRLPSMGRLGRDFQELPEVTLRLCRDAGWLLGMEMAACGLDLSFAPVLDVDDGVSTVIGDRSFAADPRAVSAMAGAFVDGLHEAGMVAVGKHFPGHGGVVADSHHELPVDPRPLDTLRGHDLVPFTDLASRLDGVMPAHVVYSSFDPRPAGFSPAWLGMLRESLGFKGVIFSDDLSMAGAAATGTPAERATAALSAGCDMLLVCNDRAAALEVLKACQGRVAQRLSKLRYARARPEMASLGALSRWRRVHARLEALASSHRENRNNHE
ncbi:beta-N-acetylhexosaminidase [Halomonas urumqiensis]|uniref:Beta-hexosaminidase n=1 Tax=Halomonas urumqiensis TaxID=1684789 RepID=A0A2N7ULR5_9GAMM|nr:beta-N-acetylhexosaminidase [Halomonas urumqiensis]PMR81375.1 beta-N-acetylhexosaminidase [Halomonas urumqiensis]PTB01175.1 beta-N-acetylhexosaminidase [Halomonas urumqiensis]GHE22745.1 beta-hexosaminidase [Halomonas urumqiensis]